MYVDLLLADRDRYRDAKETKNTQGDLLNDSIDDTLV